jgi:hypothetical protein
MDFRTLVAPVCGLDAYAEGHSPMADDSPMSLHA